MKKRTLCIVLSALLLLAFTACGQASSSVSSAPGSAPTSAAASSSAGEDPVSDIPQQQIRFAVIFGLAGLGDNGFNDEVYAGCQKAEAEYGATFDYVEPKDINDYETQIRMFADSEEYDLILAISTDQVDAVKMVAPDYPDQKFTMLDSPIEGMDNVHSVCASHPEQHFLSGIIAGLATTDDRFPLVDPTNNIIGFTIAMDNPVSRAQASGFIAGVRYVNPDAEILTSFIGSYRDPGKAKEQALSMYERGADIVSQNASSPGVFAAAEEANRYTIATSLAQVDPDHSLSTSVKKIELFILQDIEALIDGTWAPGVTTKGIKEGVCDYDIENLNTVIPDDIIEQVEAAKALIAEDKLPMPNDLDEIDAWVEQYGLK